MALRDELRRRCRSLLMEFDEEFNDPKLLRTVFEAEALKPFADNLPDAPNKATRVDLTLSYTLKLRSTRHGLVLLIFLRVLLSERCQPSDERHQKLKELIAEIELTDVTSKPEQEQKSAENRDYNQQLQTAIRSERSEAQDKDGNPQTAEQWFDEAGDNLDEWALRIALAVFNGTSYETIDRAKTELFELLDPPRPPQPPPKPDEPPQPLPPVIPPRKSVRLRNARATETQESPAKPKVVKLDDPNLAYEALRFIWREYNDWHGYLIEWLTDYAAGQPVEIRMRAAVAAGVLAKEDYVVVRNRLLLCWVNAEQNGDQYRAAVGMALGCVILDQQWRDEIRDLLKEWAISNDPARRWAAARAYIYVGVYCPIKEVIGQWRAIARSEEATISFAMSGNMFLRFALHMSLADAMVTFFLNAAEISDEVSYEKRQLIFEDALEGLEEWTKADELANDSPGFGLFMFLTLTRVLITGNTPEENWPFILLHLVDADAPQSPYCLRLARLFHKALNQSAIIQQALEPLQSWLEWIDLEPLFDAPKYEARMQTLLEAIIDCDPRIKVRMRDRLKFYLRSWANHPRSPIRSAQRLLDNLTEI